MQKVVMYTDGGARGNPGPAGVGIRIEDSKGELIKEGSKFIGKQTNNFAEYEAVRLGLMGLRKLFGDDIETMQVDVRLDSQLVERQLNGEYKVKDVDLKVQYTKVQELIDDFKKVTFTHIVREKNKDADRLANEAMDKAN